MTEKSPTRVWQAAKTILPSLLIVLLGSWGLAVGLGRLSRSISEIYVLLPVLFVCAGGGVAVIVASILYIQERQIEGEIKRALNNDER